MGFAPCGARAAPAGLDRAWREGPISRHVRGCTQALGPRRPEWRRPVRDVCGAQRRHRSALAWCDVACGCTRPLRRAIVMAMAPELGFDTIGNATLIAYDGGPVLATDPWLDGPAYFGSW